MGLQLHFCGKGHGMTDTFEKAAARLRAERQRDVLARQAVPYFQRMGSFAAPVPVEAADRRAM